MPDHLFACCPLLEQKATIKSKKMATEVATKSAIKGGEFLIRETEASEIFIPEEWSEEQKMIAQTCRDFIKQEITPRLDEIDSMKDPKLITTRT